MTERFITHWFPQRLDKDHPHRLNSPSGLDNVGKLIEKQLNKDERLLDYDYKQGFWMADGLLMIFQKREQPK
ncbi:hypothetical protein BjapCC829_21845 [Bradyrhizobium barranii]|uniref:Uncharacterized protein n=1 Tax=Bradyrhizobium barranii TaxID=2992140 RepID=A0ABY3QYD3_9BRAD|nr:hypothetical protein [Bradyrhizobium japonicum]UFW91034.1 hypothetical protein BjapCC829_21845 [Bradyrhizobium japonicum]